MPRGRGYLYWTSGMENTRAYLGRLQFGTLPAGSKTCIVYGRSLLYFSICAKASLRTQTLVLCLRIVSACHCDQLFLKGS